MAVVFLFDNLPAMIATRFALAGPAYYIGVVSGLALLVLGFLIRKRSLTAMRASFWIVAINYLIGLHLSYQNFGLGLVTIGGILWAFGMLWILSLGLPALKLLQERDGHKQSGTQEGEHAVKQA
jgi:uncharacterized YccA/Bax inhibitor family protein